MRPMVTAGEDPVNEPARSGVSPLLSDAVSLLTGIAAHACGNPGTRTIT